MQSAGNINKTFYELEIERLTAGQAPKQYLYDSICLSRQFMDTHYQEKLDVKKLAAAACMSHFHYIRMFQRVYGLTPRAYLKDMRIRKAQQMLYIGLPVTEVCYKVGYDSLPTFSAAFKKGTGLSPAVYKKQSGITI